MPWYFYIGKTIGACLMGYAVFWAYDTIKTKLKAKRATDEYY